MNTKRAKHKVQFNLLLRFQNMFFSLVKSMQQE